MGFICGINMTFAMHNPDAMPYLTCNNE